MGVTWGEVDMNQVGIQTVREWFKPYGNSRMVKPFRNNLTRMRILANPITNVETVREWFERFANGSNRSRMVQTVYKFTKYISGEASQ